MTVPPFALDQYAAISCPVKTQNAFSPLVAPPQPVDNDVVEEFRQPGHHRDHAASALIRWHPDKVRDLHDLPSGDKRVAASLAAMKAAVPIILGAELPVDWSAHRRGTVDVLLLGQADAEGRPTYHPALIRNHTVLSPTPPGTAGQLVSTLDKPFLQQALPSNRRFRSESHWPDLLQLVHLWYLLEAAGYASEQPWGAVIDAEYARRGRISQVAWIDLNDKMIRAFSYTSNRQWRHYSPVSRYRHEHRFRVRVASRALQQIGSVTDPELVASPVRVPECEMCEWWTTCQASLTDDISVKIERAPLDAREIMTLRSLGVSTIGDLASADIDTLLPQYLPRVAHRAGAEARLRLATHRGRLIASGVDLERLPNGPIELPSATVEIDLDIETSAQNRIYLWGFLVDDRRHPANQPYYHPIYRFTSMTQAQERDLAHEAAKWLHDLVASLGGADTLVWHYSAYETASLQRFADPARGHASQMLAWLNSYSRDHFFDILPVIRHHFFGVDGLGLKAVATQGPGFSWRDPEPDGLHSQYWFADAIHAPVPEQRRAAKNRILNYNEDDVWATWNLRRWLRSLDQPSDAAPGPTDLRPPDEAEAADQHLPSHSPHGLPPH